MIKPTEVSDGMLPALPSTMNFPSSSRYSFSVVYILLCCPVLHSFFQNTWNHNYECDPSWWLKSQASWVYSHANGPTHSFLRVLIKLIRSCWPNAPAAIVLVTCLRFYEAAGTLTVADQAACQRRPHMVCKLDILVLTSIKTTAPASPPVKGGSQISPVIPAGWIQIVEFLIPACLRGAGARPSLYVG